jgi:hypothetical protein
MPKNLSSFSLDSVALLKPINAMHKTIIIAVNGLFLKKAIRISTRVSLFPGLILGIGLGLIATLNPPAPLHYQLTACKLTITGGFCF